jgi:putative polymerase
MTPSTQMGMAQAETFPGASVLPIRTVSGFASPRFFCAVLIACVAFNAVLALLNGHFAPITATTVTIVQGLLTFTALALACSVRPAGMAKWLAMLWLALGWFCLLSLVRGQVELRYLGDIAAIFVFILLGLAMPARALVSAVLIMQALVIVGAVWELLDPGGFGSFFRIQQYYVNTRGFDGDSFWAGNPDLFLSSERPTGRLLLPGSGAHRASSLFLEPVSLGNWTIVVTLAIAALQPLLSRRAILFLLVGNLFLLFACDGRLALAINLVLLLAWSIAPRLPRWFPALSLPLVFVGLLAASGLGFLQEQGDTLLGRFRFGLEYLLGLDAAGLLGLRATAGVVAADSGWAYFIVTQSILALIAIWLALTVQPAKGSAARRFAVGMAIFLSLSLPVSYSVFSIKTAALLWVLFGYLQQESESGAGKSSDKRGRSFI